MAGPGRLSGQQNNRPRLNDEPPQLLPRRHYLHRLVPTFGQSRTSSNAVRILVALGKRTEIVRNNYLPWNFGSRLSKKAATASLVS